MYAQVRGNFVFCGFDLQFNALWWADRLAWNVNVLYDTENEIYFHVFTSGVRPLKWILHVNSHHPFVVCFEMEKDQILAYTCLFMIREFICCAHKYIIMIWKIVVWLQPPDETNVTAGGLLDIGSFGGIKAAVVPVKCLLEVSDTRWNFSSPFLLILLNILLWRMELTCIDNKLSLRLRAYLRRLFELIGFITSFVSVNWRVSAE